MSSKNRSTSRPSSRVSRKSRLSSVHSGLTIPSMTCGTSRLSTSTSALTSDLAVTSAVPESNEWVAVMESQGLSDIDETIGDERDAAVMSPPKGKIRILSEVSNLYTSNNFLTKYFPEYCCCEAYKPFEACRDLGPCCSHHWHFKISNGKTSCQNWCRKVVSFTNIYVHSNRQFVSKPLGHPSKIFDWNFAETLGYILSQYPSGRHSDKSDI